MTQPVWANILIKKNNFYTLEEIFELCKANHEQNQTINENFVSTFPFSATKETKPKID